MEDITQIEEILIEASAVNLRKDVIDLAWRLYGGYQIDMTLLEAYNLAYEQLIESKI